MIAAIYARKSTDQAGVSDDQRSVARQIEHAKAYAIRKGWTVDDAHVYVDDGISGAEFARRPGFLRLMNAVGSRPPFRVLVMSEESRLGREAIETAYALKQCIQAGVRVFFYLEDRERTLETPTDKLLMSVTAFADELEREKARQRTYDAMHRKALAKHVTGGRVFGYDNVDVCEPDATGRPNRVYVTRRINEAEAAVVRRIFELSAHGYGIKRIAATLNAEGAPSPRPQRGRPRGWATSSVRSVLFRPLYRGQPIWNQTRKRDTWGQHKQQERAETEWLHLDAPEWRIVPDDLWKAVHARLDASRQTYLAGTQGRAWGRPISGTVSKYLLTGLTRCGCCGGGFIVRSRDHGKHRHFRYACSTLHLRGRSVCANNLEIPMDVADGVMLDLLAQDVFRSDIIDRAIEDVWRGLSRPDDMAARRAKLESDIARVDQEIRNLTNALAVGGDVESLIGGLKAREAQRRDLRAQVEALKAAPRKALSRATLDAEVRRRLGDWRGLCGRHVAESRKLLDLVLVDRITFTPTTDTTGAPAYELRAALTFERIFSGIFVQEVWRPQRESNPRRRRERAVS
jgi:site-specific DNA recombinase